MGSVLASLIGLIFTAIALYGFYWVIRLAVRDGMLEADRRRQREQVREQVREQAAASTTDLPA